MIAEALFGVNKNGFSVQILAAAGLRPVAREGDEGVRRPRIPEPAFVIAGFQRARIGSNASRAVGFMAESGFKNGKTSDVRLSDCRAAARLLMAST